MQEKDESAIEYLERIVGWLGYEDGNLTYDLPTPAAVVEFFEMVQGYGVEFLSDVYEEIAEGNQPGAAYDKFIRKHKIEWADSKEMARRVKDGELYRNQVFG